MIIQNVAISHTLTKQFGTVITLDTEGSYCNADIDITVNATAASPSFDGGALNNKAASATFTNASTSSTNTSGVSIQTKGSAGRDAVLYNGAVNGWVNASDNATALAAANSSEWNGAAYYLTGVTIEAPASGNRTFSVTVPNGGNGTITFNFTVDSDGNTTIT